tara:strand:- start:1224 stop:1949 length:726 start_codon:yes stop_codon:yes gene_type:complete
VKVKEVLMTIIVLSFLGEAQAQLDTAQLELTLQNSSRPAADLERDQNRKAPEVLAFLGLVEGMTALDLIAIGGWYTEVLSYAVGNSGEVIMQNNPGRGIDNNIELITDRLDRRSNITHHIGPVSELPPNSVDFALTALNFHDIYNRNADEAHDRFTQVLNVLKPGGIFGVIDHEGAAGADNSTLHRIAFADAVKSITSMGFALTGVSDLLDNPADNHTLGPRDPSLERNTDRFVLRFIKLR